MRILRIIVALLLLGAGLYVGHRLWTRKVQADAAAFRADFRAKFIQGCEDSAKSVAQATNVCTCVIDEALLVLTPEQIQDPKVGAAYLQNQILPICTYRAKLAAADPSLKPPPQKH